MVDRIQFEQSTVDDTEAQFSGDVETKYVELRELTAAPAVPTDKASCMLYALKAGHKACARLSTGQIIDLTAMAAGPIKLQGEIAVAADFPLPEADLVNPVQAGWAYLITAAVTDNDPTKTNTGLIFAEGMWIAWSAATHTWLDVGGYIVTNPPKKFVDGNRTDFYAEDGSETHPFKTIADAIAAAAAGDTIVVAYKTASPYAENCVIPAGVSLEGISGNYTYIDGNITMGTSPCSLKYIVSAGVTNVLTINGGTTMRDYFSYGQMSLPLATSKVQMWNCHINATGKPAVLLGDASAEFFGVMGKLSNTGDFRVINSTAGKIMLDQYVVSAPGAATAAAIFSTTGSLKLFNTSVVNAGGGAAINANNGASIGAPNVLHGVMGAGDITLGTAYTHMDLVSLATGAVTGTGIVATNGQHFESWQHTAASETLRVFRAQRAGYIAAVEAETSVTAGAGETMTFDVRIAGATCLTGVITLAAGAPLANVPLPGTIDATARTFAAGQQITVVRAWGAGAPGLVDTSCNIEVRYF